ncbi:hypothetical protein HDV05_001434, partial [Chytridiales sp. JEL 0842]
SAVLEKKLNGSGLPVLDHLLRIHNRCLEGATFATDFGNSSIHNVTERIIDSIRTNAEQLLNGITTFVLDFVRAMPEGSKERYTIAELASKELSTSIVHLDDMGPRSRLLLRLLIIAGLTQQEKLEGALTGMLTDLAGAHGKFAFLDIGGLDFIHPLLNPSQCSSKQIRYLASAVLLTLCGEGDWLEDFLTQCHSRPELIDSVTKGMEGTNDVIVLENLAVLLQKLSRNR